MLAACLAAFLALPAAAQAASINISLAQPSPGQFQATLSGTSDQCVDYPSGDCFGEFLSAYTTTPGTACHIAGSSDHLIKFQQLSDAGGPFTSTVSFYTGTSTQLCAQVERWTYYSGNYVAAGASAVATWSLNLPPEPEKASVATKSLPVAHKLVAKISCSALCDIEASARLLRPGHDLGFGPPATIRDVKTTQYAVLTLTLGPGAVARLARHWRPSELRVWGTATFPDQTTRAFQRDIQFRRPPRPQPSHGGGGGGGCTPGYSPCIPPGPDVDCEGGGGNGPRYVQGPVTVTGSDPYGLDADGDGVGCES